MENVDVTLCFTVFFAFPWKCSISESINVGADKLGVCPRRKMINLHLPWMAKNAFNIFPIGIAVSYIFSIFVDKCKMSYSTGEPWTKWTSHIVHLRFPKPFFGHGDGKCCFYTVFYSVLCFSLKWFDQSNFHFHRGRTWRLSVLKQDNFTSPMDD